ncbi:uncharacterized protein [Epargyreus clarus]|uniref:uncharacterized protein n=1 Tax=Epargyreus clarus TaxID=520877 RepID=UPI003C2E1D22
MLHIFYFFLLLKVTNCLVGEIGALQKPSDSVLCRNCGSEILTTDSITSKQSPVSLNSFYEAIFNNETILVQILSKHSVLQFPVITSTHSACSNFQWEEDDYWFPDYKWKTCVCSECGAILGWMYQPIDSYSVVIPTQFFGLIVANLVSETCKYIFFWVWAKLWCLGKPKSPCQVYVLCVIVSSCLICYITAIYHLSR